MNCWMKSLQEANCFVDLSQARLVDFSILEKLYDFERAHETTGGTVVIGGLETTHLFYIPQTGLENVDNL